MALLHVHLEFTSGHVELRLTLLNRTGGAERVCDAVKAADAIESSCTLLSTAKGRAEYGEAVRLIAAVIRAWSARRRHDPRWRSLLEMKGLQHEAEEAIVPLATLLRWLNGRSPEGDGSVAAAKYTLADMCCGKGIFSLLLSHAAALQPQLRQVGQILMIDRATRAQVDWTMVDDCIVEVQANRQRDAGPAGGAGAAEDSLDTTAAACARSRASGGSCKRGPTDGASALVAYPVIPIELWWGCNLHEQGEEVEERLRSSPGQVIVLGIHLCRRLSPCAVSLYNHLGRAKAPLLMLAPCCLPRLSGPPITVGCYETPEARQARLDATRRRWLIKRGRRLCWGCLREGHVAAECPLLAHDASSTDDPAVDGLSPAVVAASPSTVSSAAAGAQAVPGACWRCGRFGHHKSACPASAEDTRPSVGATQGACSAIDVQAVGAVTDKFGAWVKALLNAVEAADGEREMRHVPLDTPAGMPAIGGRKGASEGESLQGVHWGGLEDVTGSGGMAEKKRDSARVGGAAQGAAAGGAAAQGDAIDGGGGGEDPNWNRHRKCHWIVAAREVLHDHHRPLSASSADPGECRTGSPADAASDEVAGGAEDGVRGTPNNSLSRGAAAATGELIVGGVVAAGRLFPTLTAAALAFRAARRAS